MSVASQLQSYVFLLAALCISEPAHAKRVALVVGISEYEHSPKLANPGRDAAGVSVELRSSGFEVVYSLNPSMSALLQAVDQFYAKADGAETALFFFAGHALQFDGVNYIVPKDAKLRSETRLKLETLALQDILAAIEKRAKVALVFLDACRDNPLAEALQRNAKGASRTASVAHGLAPMSIKNPDTLLVFAAAPGKTASDGVGANSPFTAALLRHMREPGVEIELMLKRVTRDVVQATNGEQVPERLSRLTSEFVFNRAPERPIPPTRFPAPHAKAVLPSPALQSPAIQLEKKGIGISPAEVREPMVRRRMAERAAEIDARRQIQQAISDAGKDLTFRIEEVARAFDDTSGQASVIIRAIGTKTEPNP